MCKKQTRATQDWKPVAAGWTETFDGWTGPSPRPLAGDEDENSADGDEAVLKGGHG